MQKYQKFLQDHYKQRYTLQNEIGRGTYGKVYSALDNQKGQHVAIKFIKKIPSNTRLCAQLDKEIEILETLSKSVGIVQIIGKFQEDTKIILIMEKMQTDLGKVLWEEKKLDRKILTDNICIIILGQLLGALSQLRKVNILHRDIKPANIGVNRSIEELRFYDQKQVNFQCKLLDFGLAKDQVIAYSHDIGTPGYQDPQILEKKPYSYESDIYSLGITMVYLATGIRPFPYKDYSEADLLNIQHEVFRDVLRQMIVKDPSKRIVLDLIIQHRLFFPIFSQSTRLDYPQEYVQVEEEPQQTPYQIEDLQLEQYRYTLFTITADQLKAVKRNLLNSKYDYLCMSQQFENHIEYLMRNAKMMNRNLQKTIQSEERQDIVSLRRQLIKDHETLYQNWKNISPSNSQFEKFKSVFKQGIFCVHISKPNFNLNFYKNNQEIYTIIQGLIININRDHISQQIQEQPNLSSNLAESLTSKYLRQLNTLLIYIALCKGSIENMKVVYLIQKQICSSSGYCISLQSILDKLRLNYN